MTTKIKPFHFTQSISLTDANPLMQGLSFYERNTNWKKYTSLPDDHMNSPEKWFTAVSQLALAPFVVGQKQIQLGLMQYMDWLTLLSPPTRQSAPSHNAQAKAETPKLTVVPTENKSVLASQPVAEPEAPADPEPVLAPAQAELTAIQNDLTLIKGIGPSLAQKLNELGIHSFAQIAAWTQADIDQLEATIIRFPGRIVREDWIGQAKALSEQQ